MVILPANIKELSPGLSSTVAKALADSLPAILEKFHINTELRVAHFLAQTSHESGGFRSFVENLNYTASRLMEVFPNRFSSYSQAAQYAHNPEKTANRIYANMIGNGNEASGDGWKFRGRGIMQLTGRANYQAFKNDTGIDVVSNPDYLMTAQGAAYSAAWFWSTHGLNALADKNDVVAVTRRINGGTNGLDDRRRLTNIAYGVAEDIFDNAGGPNTQTGGTGNNIFIVDNVGDKVIEKAGGGTDLVKASVSYTLGANVENLTLTGTAAINATGNTLNNVLTGNSAANTLNGGAGADTMRGGLGNDTYVVSNIRDVVVESAGAGVDLVKSAISYALGANVENLTLTGTAAINATGNTLNNVLTGNAAANTLNGGAGADTMRGGLGNDTYVVDNIRDVVVEGAGAGTDRVLSSVTYTLGANVENLILTGTAAINGTGNTLNNVLTGNGAANVLNGGVGADTMAGGLGNDTYLVDNIGDKVVEGAGAGADLVKSAISYALGANVENLTLTGTAAINGAGNALNNVLIGNSAANTLNGGAGADTLNGGAGADVMIGGLGNDTYVVDNVGDKVIEKVGEGTDLVQSTVTYTLGADLENLTLLGTAAINGTGNALNNVLIGNGAANVLNGGAGADTLNGGAGADAMTGGLGNDTYVVDNVGDKVIEKAGEGTDRVLSAVTYTLGADLENLTLTGTAAINGAGNALNNVLIGNSAANTLNGGAGADTLNGGAGADVMIGGLGNDTFVVDNIGDKVIEKAGEGTDRVLSAVTYTLGADLENLTLIGTAAINATGNALNNVLTGNSAANVLNGGAGADTMIGGLGNDTYLVTALGDTIIEKAGEGTDLVKSAVTYTLGDNVENLTLVGTTTIHATGNALNNVLTGNSAANTLNGGIGADAMAGGLGNDTYVVDNIGDKVTENAGAGTDRVLSAVTYTLGANVENLTLTGTAAINGTGNTLNNTLTGNSAANTLNGGAGADAMTGGLGNDTYVVDNVGDKVIEKAGEGTDRVLSAVTYTLGADLENLTLTGTAAINGAGNALNNVLIGNSAANTLNGGAGADTLNGGAGADVMIGGLGNDTFVVDNIGDKVIEKAGEGTDRVLSAVTYTLGADLENLTLIGTAAINATGNALNNVLTGNSAANVLNGGAGADTMNGGAGADTMVGGLGNDTYVVDNIGDIVIDKVGEGTDLVQSTVTYALGANVENLSLTGTAAINATGNTLNNVLTGNSAANILNGGAGADVMIGGLGNDTYLVDNIGDVVTENVDGGADLVQSAVTYTLGDNVENLTLTGTAAINGTGNTLNNVLTGNGAANFLNGGAGADTMVGGLGNDTYVVDNIGDVVTENANGGADLVQSAITYTLGANVENLTLLGTAAINATGNALNNILLGNSAANTLDGGVGADTMIGGDGSDTYIVDNVGDLVTESNATTAGGMDVVHSYLTAYTLGANVENGRIRLDGAANLTGNALNNVLYAGSGNNVLSGGGGSDTVSYRFGLAGVAVSLAATSAQATGGSGTDTLTGIENLTGSDYNDTLTGNGGTNILAGGAGNDTLKGGAGNDTLTGGNGNDNFKFITTAEGADNITDFTSGADKIQVVAGNFGLTAGAAVTFRSGSSPVASGAMAQFLYNATTGGMYFDRDGTNGVYSAVQIATLTGPRALVGSDIQVVNS